MIHTPRPLLPACSVDELSEVCMEIRACIHGLPYRRPELHEAYVVRLHSMPGSIHIHKFGNMSGGRIHDIDKGGCPAPDELACLLQQLQP